MGVAPLLADVAAGVWDVGRPEDAFSGLIRVVRVRATGVSEARSCQIRRSKDGRGALMSGWAGDGMVDVVGAKVPRLRPAGRTTRNMAAMMAIAPRII